MTPDVLLSKYQWSYSDSGSTLVDNLVLDLRRYEGRFEDPISVEVNLSEAGARAVLCIPACREVSFSVSPSQSYTLQYAEGVAGLYGNALDTIVYSLLRVGDVVVVSGELSPYTGSFFNFAPNSTVKAGDIVYYRVMDGSFDVQPIGGAVGSDMIPIGIVAIPPSHNVYGDGRCGVVSVRFMSPETPSVGLVDPDRPEILTFGRIGGSYMYPDRGHRVPYTTRPTTSPFTYNGSNVIAAFPSDVYSGQGGTTCAYDNRTAFYRSPGTNFYAPSPYLNASYDVAPRASEYYATDREPTNCFADFDGIGNTKYALKFVTGQMDWRTAGTILDIDGCLPAICCCQRYHTIGTHPGDWYLPSMGELGYITSRMNVLIKSYEAVAYRFAPNFRLLSSTHETEVPNRPYTCSFSNGVIQGAEIDTPVAVLAMTRM